MEKLRVLGTVAVLALSSFTFATTTYAQTQGMERRDDRRDDRSAGRAAKQACKAGDEKSRAECRQVKRDVKRNDGQKQSGQVPPPAGK